MKIETKFDIGQKVWFVDLWLGIEEVVISGVEIWKDKTYTYIIDAYFGEFAEEGELFATKEEAEQKLKELEE